MFNVHWLFYQVLRYHQNGEPLWVSDEGKPNDGDIPKCECGSERVFEFQVIIKFYTNTNLSQNCVCICNMMNTTIIKLLCGKELASLES